MEKWAHIKHFRPMIHVGQQQADEEPEEERNSIKIILGKRRHAGLDEKPIRLRCTEHWGV